MNAALGQALALAFEFKPAGVTQEMTILGGAPIFDLSSARVGVNVTKRKNGRCRS